MVSTSLLRISFCAETVASCSAREARERSSELIVFCEEQGANPTVHCASSSHTNLCKSWATKSQAMPPHLGQNGMQFTIVYINIR